MRNPNPEDNENLEAELETTPVEVVEGEIEEIDQDIDNFKRDFSRQKEELLAYLDIGKEVDKTPTEGIKIATGLAAGGALGAAGTVIEVVYSVVRCLSLLQLQDLLLDYIGFTEVDAINP